MPDCRQADERRGITDHHGHAGDPPASGQGTRDGKTFDTYGITCLPNPYEEGRSVIAAFLK